MDGRYVKTTFLCVFLCFVQSRTIGAETWTRSWSWWPFAYDDTYITKHLDDRYPYLKLHNGNYMGPRDYFNFSHVHEPSREYLEQINLEQHLYEELKFMEVGSSIATMDQWHYTDEAIESLLDGEADQEKCLTELHYLKNQVLLSDFNSDHLFKKGLKNQHMLRLLDTWGRPPSETYFGNSYWAGSYRGCKILARLSSKFANGGRGEHKSGSDLHEYRYCWAKVRAKDWPLREEIIPPVNIRVGVCLPSSCNTKLANQNKELLLDIMKFNFSPMHKARYNRIIHVYCLPKKTANNLSSSSSIFSIIVANWILFLAGLSMFASIFGKQNMPQVLYNLTIQENYARFAGDDEPPIKTDPRKAENPVDLRPIGVVRFVTTMAVCVAHCVCTCAWVAKSSSFNVITAERYSWVMSLFKSNDVFWVITGLLTSYTILSRFKREKLLKPSVWFGTILARYLRLACIQVLVLSFIKAIYLSLGEGPYWDYGTYKYSMQGQCQRSSWWRVLLIPILFSTKDGNNYVHECLPVTWTLVADMKLSLVAPALVYLLASKSAPKRWISMGILSLISLFAQYNDLSHQQLIYFQQFFAYNQPTAINMLSLAFGETGYYNTLTRLSSLSIGMMAGIYLHERKAWPRLMRGWWFLAIIGYQTYEMFAPWLSVYRYKHHGEMPTETTIKWALLLKPRLDAVMFAIIMVRVASDLAPKVVSHTKSFYKLGKISYCVLLVHPMVISYLVNADESSRTNLFHSEFVRLIFSCIGLSYLISFPLYILFESPLALLTSQLFKRQKSTD